MAIGVEIIFNYFPDLTDKQKSQFEKLWFLYQEWNAKINVVSRKDIEELYVKHILHSLGIARVITFDRGNHVLDVGTGGGFPGIPLAILFPDTHFHLVDSIGKKIKVVEEVVRGTGLTNVTYEHTRAEKAKGKYDYIVSRAVTRMKPFTQWVRNKISSHPHAGIYYLKGGDLTEEMAEIHYPWKEYHLKNHFKEEFFETKKVIFVSLSSHRS